MSGLKLFSRCNASKDQSNSLNGFRYPKTENCNGTQSVMIDARENYLGYLISCYHGLMHTGGISSKAKHKRNVMTYL